MSAAKKKEAAKKNKVVKKKGRGSAAPEAPQPREWNAAIDRVDFLEIASLRRVLLSGVSVSPWFAQLHALAPSFFLLLPMRIPTCGHYSKNAELLFQPACSLSPHILLTPQVNRHVMGLVHPVSVFTTKAFDGLFWYKRHGGGAQQYDFKHLVDVIPVNGPQSVGDAFPQVIH